MGNRTFVFSPKKTLVFIFLHISISHLCGKKKERGQEEEEEEEEERPIFSPVRFSSSFEVRIIIIIVRARSFY